MNIQAPFFSDFNSLSVEEIDKYIIPIYSITELDLGHDTSPEDTAYGFDVDDVLTILGDPAFHRPNFKFHHLEAFDEVMGTLSKVEYAMAFTMPLLTTPSNLIETEAPQFISSLQKRAKTLAITAAMGVEIDGASLEERRASELVRVGIDFSSSFPEIPEFVLSGFKPPVLGRDPLFNKGILYTNESNKGKVTVEFFKAISWEPKNFGFVDDRIDHVRAVVGAMKNHFPKANVKGFHFQPTKVPYASARPEHFTAKWREVANRAKELVASKKYFPRVDEAPL